MADGAADLFVPLARVWAQNAGLFAAKPAIVSTEQTVDWRTLGARMHRIAFGLRALGLRAGDRVALLAHGSVTGVEALMGLFRAGLVAVPISPLLTPAQARVAARDADCKVAIATESFAAHAPLLDVSDLKLADGFSFPGWQDYRTWRDGQTTDRDIGWPGADDPAIIIYSSGTTGAPKGIVHSQGGRAHFASLLGLAFGIGRTSVSLLTTPVSSNATSILLLPTLLMGGTVRVMAKFDPAAVLTSVRDGATHVFAVPTAIQAMIAAARGEVIDAPDLRVLLSAGSFLPPAMKREATNIFGPIVHELYGCTEGMMTILYPDELLGHAGTVGRAVLGAEIGVIGGDDRLLPPGAAGEVVGRAGLMMGYHNRPDATADAFWIDATGRRWFRSGDIGRLDEEGYLTILDRKKDMIVSGGYNVYPADIETVLIEHPGIDECAVVAAPHDRWGEAPFAFFVGRCLEAELMTWSSERLAKHQRLIGARAVTMLPRNLLGKVVKRDLRDRLTGDIPARPV